MWNTCQAHGGEDEDYFLPWHRAFVYYFESIIRTLCENDSFTLPYWNYSTTDQAIRGVIPPEFTKPSDPVFEPLYVGKRNTGVNQGKPIQNTPQAPPGDPLSTAVLAECTYDPQGALGGFCMDLDGGLHGLVHVMIGNTQNMGQVPWAAGDPIFWLHHCNIDRLWASWSAGGRSSPAKNEVFVFADTKGNRITANLKDFVSITPLGYTYDHLEPVPPCPAPRTALVAASKAQKKAAAVKATPIQLGASPVRVTLEATPEQPGADVKPLLARVRALPAERDVYLVLKGLRTDFQPGVLYHLYLDLPDKAAGADRKPHYVGTLNFFGAGTGEGAHATGKKGPERFKSFKITGLIKGLEANGQLKEKPVLTIVPDGQPEEDAKPVIGEISIIEQ